MVCKKTFLNIWNVERHQKKEHGLTEKGNVVENSAGIAMFTTEALVKETVTEKRTEKIRHRCDQCEYNSYKRLNVRTHMQNKHNGIVKPEMRGRKKKTGTLSERTNRRRKANNVNNFIERNVSFLGKNLRMSERDLHKVVQFTKRKSSEFSLEMNKYIYFDF